MRPIDEEEEAAITRLSVKAVPGDDDIIYPSVVPFLQEAQIANPWTKKNPFLSMFLSGAHAIAGRARSVSLQQHVEGKPQQ